MSDVLTHHLSLLPIVKCKVTHCSLDSLSVRLLGVDDSNHADEVILDSLLNVEIYCVFFILFKDFDVFFKDGMLFNLLEFVHDEVKVID